MSDQVLVSFGLVFGSDADKSLRAQNLFHSDRGREHSEMRRHRGGRGKVQGFVISVKSQYIYSQKTLIGIGENRKTLHFAPFFSTEFEEIDQVWILTGVSFWTYN